jgi:hypothetical protein
MSEPHAVSGDSIYVRRGHEVSPGTCHQVVPMLIGHNNQNIGPVAARRYLLRSLNAGSSVDVVRRTSPTT